MHSISDSINSLPRVTKPTLEALRKLGIQTLGDLLFHFPFRYVDFSKLTSIQELAANEAVTIQGTITSIQGRFSFRGRMSLCEAIVTDGTASVKVTWFNQGYLAKTLRKGEEIFLSGTPDYYNGKLQLTNPVYEKVSDFPIHTSRLVPVYHLTEKLYPKTLRGFIAQALPLAKQVEDTLPEELRARQGLPSLENTIRISHFPNNPEEIKVARKRLAFEEIFINQLLAQKHKAELAHKKSFVVPFSQSLIKNFIDSLPFQLTPGQRRAAWDILQDLEKPVPMNRLLEGDVGSGKTLVAFVAALQAVSQELQVTLLAPTEILAQQHFQSAQKFLGPKVKVCLLTGNFSAINNQEIPKKKLRSLASDGMPALYVGTHALLQDTVNFPQLALVIIDEQHRFGVEQRSTLMRRDGKVPHLLSLSATPIPRTLQLAYYGELEISQIKSKPANRKPITTKLVLPNERAHVYSFISQQIAQGRQAFVITPLIEESEKSELKAAKTEVQNLQKIFPKLTIGLMHGKLKGAEKEAVMKDFLENKTQVLVSTSVVEVGVDVPNASVMVIEGADRFGLAQLHQFRGRVGRAEHQSHCFLFTDNQNEETLQRLEAFTKTQDGFELAELDLKQRGFGELYGSQQSGWNFKYFNPSYVSLIPPAREEAAQILDQDPQLSSHPLLQEQIKDKVIHFE